MQHCFVRGQAGMEHSGGSVVAARQGLGQLLELTPGSYCTSRFARARDEIAAA
jgi:hypothetical protein